MRKDGQVVVVDFKFGKKNEAYRAQVQEYMDLLTQMATPTSGDSSGMCLPMSWKK